MAVEQETCVGGGSKKLKPGFDFSGISTITGSWLSIPGSYPPRDCDFPPFLAVAEALIGIV